MICAIIVSKAHTSKMGNTHMHTQQHKYICSHAQQHINVETQNELTLAE